MGDFDVKAVHLVVLHAQVGDAAARALARFELEQKGVAVGLQGAQAIELGLVAVVDHAAFAQLRRRFGQQGALQQVGAARWRDQVLRYPGQ